MQRVEQLFSSKRQFIIVVQVVFLVTGVFQTIGNQSVYYQGAGDKRALLGVLAKAFGMVLAVLIPKEKRSEKPQPRQQAGSSGLPITAQQQRKASPAYKIRLKLSLIALIDCLAQVIEMLGIIMAGSGLFQVVYSSVVIFTALLSRVMLQRQLSLRKWLGIVIITMGLMFSAMGAFQGNVHDGAHSISDKHVAQTTATNVLVDMSDSMQLAYKKHSQGVGIVMTLCCTFLFAINYVLSESLLTTASNAPSPLAIQSFTGSVLFCFSMGYCLIYTVPNWDQLVVQSIRSHKGSIASIVILYTGLVIAAFLHCITYYTLLSSLGATSTGVLQSLRAVSVFGMSAWLFCETHHAQCFNTYKGISTFFVVMGILFFSFQSFYKSEKKIFVVDKMEKG
eukprot:TRINITY_DN8085_c0_g1_i5.p1 TRINITY_DN8085_c0_g1~~TRINITY_DN8085_c0_g1_i5.p1  ORF type:complete len:393 (-),score=24.87 TRINITY_DN8085_c0_g1_i5:339-1517(-)